MTLRDLTEEEEQQIINDTMDLITESDHMIDQQMMRAIRIYPELFQIDDYLPLRSESEDAEDAESTEDSDDDYQSRSESLRMSLSKWR